jgi:hypothetical protein
MLAGHNKDQETNLRGKEALLGPENHRSARLSWSIPGVDCGGRIGFPQAKTFRNLVEAIGETKKQALANVMMNPFDLLEVSRTGPFPFSFAPQKARGRWLCRQPREVRRSG